MNALMAVRLLQLSSQALPIGGYSHSQGLEPAIEAGAVGDEAGVARWLAEVFEFSLSAYELPMLLEFYAAWTAAGTGGARASRLALQRLNDEMLASRESKELRAASVQMGFSMVSLLAALPDFPTDVLTTLQSLEEPCLPCAWSAAASAWGLGRWETALAYGWAWAENQVLVAIKTVPLGQSAGQRILSAASTRLAQWIDAERATPRAGQRGLSNFAPGLAILSSRHETQYSRLFRS